MDEVLAKLESSNDIDDVKIDDGGIKSFILSGNEDDINDILQDAEELLSDDNEKEPTNF